MKPKNLKQAIDSDYLIKRINYTGSKNCLVILQPRFYNSDKVAQVSFWINSAYVKRNYPDSFNKWNY